MILERIRLRGFGRFADERVFPAEGEFHPRLHVIAGENEAGKSTLFTALHHALFTPYSSTARELKAMQPWGTELTPWVQVDLRVSERRFRLTKSFLYDPVSRLAEWRDGAYVPIADGDRADERIRTLFWAEKPTRGVAQDQHRGVARLLWIPQGEAAPAELTGTLRERVEAALGAMSVSPEERQLRGRIAEEYGEWWTATGRPKAGGLDVLEKEVDALRQQLRRLDDELIGFDEATLRLEGILARQAELSQRRDEREQAIGALQADAQRIAQLKAAHTEAVAQLNAAEERFRRCDQRREALRLAEAEAAEADRLLAQLAEEAEGVEHERAAAQRERTEAVDVVTDAAEAVRRAEEAYRTARLVDEAKRRVADAAEQRGRLERALELQRAAEALRQELTARPVPTPEVLDEVRRIEAELHRLEGALDAVGLQMGLRTEADVRLTLTADRGPAEEVELPPHAEVQWRATRSATLHLPGYGTLHIRSGATEAEGLERQRDERRNALQGLLRTYAASSPHDLVRQHEEYRRQREQFDRLQAEVKREIHPHGRIADLRAACEEAERAIVTLAAQLGRPVEALADLPAPDLPALEEGLARLRKGEEEARRRLQQAQERLDRATARTHAVQQRHVQLETQRTAARTQAEALIREAGSEAAIETDYHTARREREAAQHRVADLTQQLPQGADDPAEQVERLRTEVQRIDEELNRLLQQRAEHEALLRQVAERGSYDERATLEERLAIAERRLEEARRKALALKLLHRLSEARQEQMTRSLTEPVAQRVSGYFERVSGRLGRAVQIDEALQPTAFDERTTPNLPPTVLSAGAREQLYHLTRLALARFLAQREGRMLFVLDDTLVYTDAVRHRRFLQLLEDACADLQIIILTCHMERYQGLKEAPIEILSI